MVTRVRSGLCLLAPTLLVAFAAQAYSQTAKFICRETVVEGGASGSIEWKPTPAPAGDNATWCDTVGPALIIAPTTSTTNAGVKVLLASWNVHVGGGSIDRFLADVNRRYGKTHVVLLLQETFRAGADVGPLSSDIKVPDRIGQPGSSPDIRGAARQLKWWAYYVPSMRNGKDDGWTAQDRGNGILSSLPLADFRAFELPFVRQRRVAIAATVLGLDSKPLFRVVSVHFATGGASGRAEQAQDLVESIKDLVKAELPLVLGGDFNTVDSKEPASVVLGSLLSRADCGGKPTTLIGTLLKWITLGIKWDFELDHIFSSRPLLAQGCVRGDRFKSDHYSLFLPLNLVN